MTRWALAFGLILLVLGILGYENGNHASAALMPAYFGIILGVLGATARTGKEKTRMVTMHIAATVGVIGFLMTMGGLWDFVQMQRGQYVENRMIVQNEAATAAILLFFVLLCVLSFIKARRARQAVPEKKVAGSTR